MHTMPCRFSCSLTFRCLLLALLVGAIFCRLAIAKSGQKSATIQSQRTASQTYCKAVQSYEKTSPPALFFGRIDSGDKPSHWRRYRSKDELDNAGASDAAFLWIRGAAVVGANFTFQSESGDWANYANYCFREDGSLAEVDAELRTFYGNMLVKRAWFYAPHGALVGKTEGFFGLKTGKPMKPGQDFIDEKTPQFRAVKNLPFASLLADTKAGR